MTVAGRALSLADELERWIQFASRPVAPETRCVEVATDITMQDMEEWDQVEAEMSPDEREFTDEKAEALRAQLQELAEEEQRLSEEFANLKAELKQEKAFNHQQSQAHQQQVRKLKAALSKRKKEAEAKEQQQRKEKEKAKEGEASTRGDGAGGSQAPATATAGSRAQPEIEGQVADQSSESSGETHKSKLNALRSEIHTLNRYMKEEHQKEQRLRQELDKVAEEESQILTETKQCKAKVRLRTSQATMLKQMVNVSSAELEGWSEQVERLQIRKQEARDTAKERQVMEKCAKKYQRRQQGLPDEKDSEGKTIPSNPSSGGRTSRSTGLSLKETSVSIWKGTMKKSVVIEKGTNAKNRS